MNCKKIEESLSSYLENDLDPKEKAEVEEHLNTCPGCSLLLSFIKETKDSLVDFPELELSDNLLANLHSIPSKKKKFKLNLDFLLRPSLQPVLASATILLTLLSFYFFHPNKKYIDQSISRQIHLGYSKVEKLYARAESFTDSLNEFKDNILVSLKQINPLSRNGE